MPVFEHDSPLPYPADAVYTWHSRPGAFARLVPPWDDTRVLKQVGPFEDARVYLEVHRGPLKVSWVAHHLNVQPGREFTDVQEHGPFTKWEHVHRFVPQGPGCRLEDRVDYELPAGGLGQFFGGVPLRHMLERMFDFRHTRLRHDLARHAAFAAHGPQRIAITGATGLVGRALTAFLRTGGHTVLRLTRGTALEPDDVQWNPDTGEIDLAALEGLDAVVHLAGHNVSNNPWTTEEKRKILDSRIKGTTLISQSLAGLRTRPRVFISASAVGFYGHRGDERVNETAPAGSGFLADVCQQWEKATQAAQKADIRTVHLRIGVVLTALLQRMYVPFSLGLGATLGDGHQMMSWVSLDDLVGIIYHLMFSDISGPVNAASPAPVSAGTFTRTLGKVMHRPTIFSVPKPVVKGMFGEMGGEVLLEGAAATPDKLLADKFAFFYPALEAALANELPMRQT